MAEDDGLSEGQDRSAGVHHRHRFADHQLLADALVHSSHHRARQNGTAFQKLEFLGDRVLNLAVASETIETSPWLSSVKFEKQYKHCISNYRLKCIALDLELDSLMSVGNHIHPSQYAPDTDVGSYHVFADAAEALIGALYRDGGMGAAKVFLRMHWQEFKNQDSPLPRLPDHEELMAAWAESQGITRERWAALQYMKSEFLGERIIAFALTDKLIDLFPAASTPELHEKIKRLTSPGAMSQIGLRVKRIGSGTYDPDDPLMEKIDAIADDPSNTQKFLAMMAAQLYRSDPEKAYACVRRMWQPILNSIAPAAPEITRPAADASASAATALKHQPT
ncbi:MAG: ribonuclease III domain-containing protein [Alphaproteobacteria bacterium]